MKFQRPGLLSVSAYRAGYPPSALSYGTMIFTICPLPEAQPEVRHIEPSIRPDVIPVGTDSP